MHTVFMKTSEGNIIQTANPEMYLANGGSNPTVDEVFTYFHNMLEASADRCDVTQVANRDYPRGCGKRDALQNPATIKAVRG